MSGWVKWEKRNHTGIPTGDAERIVHSTRSLQQGEWSREGVQDSRRAERKPEPVSRGHTSNPLSPAEVESLLQGAQLWLLGTTEETEPHPPNLLEILDTKRSLGAVSPDALSNQAFWRWVRETSGCWRYWLPCTAVAAGARAGEPPKGTRSAGATGPFFPQRLSITLCWWCFTLHQMVKRKWEGTQIHFHRAGEKDGFGAERQKKRSLVQFLWWHFKLLHLVALVS